MIRVLIADDHRLLVDGLRLLLDKKKNIAVVGVAQDGSEAIDLANKTQPNIILLDISMPRLNGIDAARQILHNMPDVKIIMLSMHADKRYIQQALRVGAKGYILKESAVSEVLMALDVVQSGKLFFSKTIRDQVIAEYVELIQSEDSLSPHLTAREREVLQIISEGNSTKEIASLLNISVKTVESHRKNIMDKLDVHSVAGLTKYAIRQGLTRLD